MSQPYVAYLFWCEASGLMILSFSPEFRAWMAPASKWRVVPLIIDPDWLP